MWPPVFQQSLQSAIPPEDVEDDRDIVDGSEILDATISALASCVGAVNTKNTSAAIGKIANINLFIFHFSPPK